MAAKIDLQYLMEHQRLETSAARCVSTFVTSGNRYLIVPQLAEDVPGTPAFMNGGTSDVDALVYRWERGLFVRDGQLPLPGGEDVLYFKIRDREFLVGASIRTGRGPFEYNVDQTLYTRLDDRWEPYQSFAGFAAKQWHFFQIGERSFLALAQGVTLGHIEAKNPRRSRIFEWDGQLFTELQVLDGEWGYNWESFSIGSEHFLCYADHAGASSVLKWDGASFAPFQVFSPSSGRCFRYFTIEGGHFLAFASIQGTSEIFRWDEQKFTPHQVLSGPGGREFCVFRSHGALFLVQVNFITGLPSAPNTAQKSRLYRWANGSMELVQEFATFGGTEATFFEQDGEKFLAVSNSLTPDVRFRQDTIIYRFNG
jgi:hypothetical protein